MARRGPCNDARVAAAITADIERHVARGRISVAARGLGLAGRELYALGDVEAEARARLDVDSGELALAEAGATATHVTGGIGPSRVRVFSADRVHVGGRAPALPSLRGADLDLVAAAHVVVRSFDGDALALDLSGSTVEVRRPGWRGRARLAGGALRLDGDPVLDGEVTLEADDATPFLALLGVPKLPAMLLEMPGLRARALVTLGAGEVAFREVDARGGNVRIRGAWVRPRGMFTVRKGLLSIGVRVEDDGLHLVTRL